jgi:nitrile hydratase
VSADRARAAGAPNQYEMIAQALEELLVAKGVLAEDRLREQLARQDAAGPAHGARLVARSWVDPAFAARLMASVNVAAKELGLDIGWVPVHAVANTPDLHNVVVCTLCSCYATGPLGLKPEWYRSPEYRARIVREPRAVLAKFGLALPADVAVRVHDATAERRYLVIPMRPAGTAGMSEAELARLVTRDSMIGTAVAQAR